MCLMRSKCKIKGWQQRPLLRRSAFHQTTLPARPHRLQWRITTKPCAVQRCLFVITMSRCNQHEWCDPEGGLGGFTTQMQFSPLRDSTTHYQCGHFCTQPPISRSSRPSARHFYKAKRCVQKLCAPNKDSWTRPGIARAPGVLLYCQIHTNVCGWLVCVVWVNHRWGGVGRFPPGSQTTTESSLSCRMRFALIINFVFLSYFDPCDCVAPEVGNKRNSVYSSECFMGLL